MKGKFVEATPREPRDRSLWSRIRAKWFVRDLVLVSVIALTVFGVLTQAFWFLAVRELDERILVKIPEGASVRRRRTDSSVTPASSSSRLDSWDRPRACRREPTSSAPSSQSWR
jgi:hypothetical protein